MWPDHGDPSSSVATLPDADAHLDGTALTTARPERNNQAGLLQELELLAGDAAEALPLQSSSSSSPSTRVQQAQSVTSASASPRRTRGRPVRESSPEEAERARKRPRLDFDSDHHPFQSGPSDTTSSATFPLSNHRRQHASGPFQSRSGVTPLPPITSFTSIGDSGDPALIHQAASSSSGHLPPASISTASSRANTLPPLSKTIHSMQSDGEYSVPDAAEHDGDLGSGRSSILVESVSSSSSRPPSLTEPRSINAPPPVIPALDLPSPLPTPSSSYLSPAFQNGYPKVKETNGFGTSTSSLSINDAVSSASSSVVKVNPPGTTIYEDSSIDREEFVRLTIQLLKDIGYNESASTLEAESGYSLETPLVTEFRKAVYEGNWSKVSEMLPSMGVPSRDLQSARYLISQQNYLELLEQRLTSRALNVLRTELAPNSIDSDRLHILSSLMMCSDPADLCERAKWDGVSGSSRKRLLSELQRFIPTETMVPQRRMAVLLEHAIEHQRSQCLYHDPRAPTSLYTDHECSRNSFPTLTTNILEHEEEVWNLSWSHDGRYLASASKDKKATIWYIGPETEAGRECSVVQTLKGHSYSVTVLAWSLDDKALVTGAEQHLKMWDVETGDLIAEMKGHKHLVSSVVALPDGSGYVSGGMDKEIIFWDSKGHSTDQWVSPSMRVLDLDVTPDGTKLVVAAVVDREVPLVDSTGGLVSSEQGFTSVSDSLKSPISKPSGSRASSQNGALRNGTTAFEDEGGIPMRRRVIVYDLETKEELFKMAFPKEITSLKVSADSRYALINHAPDDLILWDLTKHRIAHKYSGQQQREDVIRSCFGGIGEDFVLSGSEDSNVYIWRKETGTLVEVLSGHGKGNVNAVAWNPKEDMFASCSDDRSIRIWEAPPPGVDDMLVTNGEYEVQQPSAGLAKSVSPTRMSFGYVTTRASYDGGSVSPRVVR